jgi:hypothetical protein
MNGFYSIVEFIDVFDRIIATVPVFEYSRKSLTRPHEGAHDEAVASSSILR